MSSNMFGVVNTGVLRYVNFSRTIPLLSSEAARKIRPIDSKKVFFTGEVNLRELDYFGFDFDYTIASYTNEVLRMIYTEALKILIEEKSYPLDYNQAFDKSFPIRGLHFDTRTGLLMKIDAYNNIQMDTVHLGKNKLTVEQAEARGLVNKKLSPQDIKKHLRHLVDLFSLPEACLISDVAQALLDEKSDYNPQIVFDDVRESISRVHERGIWHNAVIRDPAQYLHRGKEAAGLFESLRIHGKKTFLLTNSDYRYVDHAMRYLLGDCTSEEWRGLFDIVICSADKPRFFIPEAQRPFRRITNLETGHRSYTAGEPDFTLPGTVWTGGNAQTLMKLTKWDPRRTIYIGDHLYSDLSEAARSHGWTVGAVIRELDNEIVVQNKLSFQQRLQASLAYQTLIYDAMSSPHQSDPILLHNVAEWQTELERLKAQMKLMYNPHFGSIFRSRLGLSSYFMTHLTTTVELYMSRVENLKSAFESPPAPVRRTYLPHEAVPAPFLFDPEQNV